MHPMAQFGQMMNIYTFLPAKLVSKGYNPRIVFGSFLLEILS